MPTGLANKKTGILVVYALSCLLCSAVLIKLDCSWLTVAFHAVLFVCIGVVYRLRETEKRFLPFSAFLALLAASCISFGYVFDTFGALRAMRLAVLAIFASSIILLPVFQLFFSAVNKPRTSKRTPKKVLLACVLFVGFVWLVYYLVLFPGVYGYDGAFWLLEYDDPEVPISSQWSIPYTFSYYCLFRLGSFLFGSAEGGFALFSFAQIVFVFFSAAVVLRYIARKFSTSATVAGALFYCIIPLFPILSVSSAQDALFMAVFSLFAVKLSDVLYMDKERLSGRNLLPIAVYSFLICIIRNNGMYALLFAVLVVVFALKGAQKIRISIALVAPIVILAVFQGPLCSSLGIVSNASIREASSLPVMQIVRTFNNHEAEISESDVELVKRYFDTEGFDYYEINSEISDLFKSKLRTSKVSGNLADAACLYVSLGVKYPVDYMEAAAMLSLGLWYPFKSYPDGRMYHPYIESESLDATAVHPHSPVIKSASLFPAADGLINKLFGGTSFTMGNVTRGSERFSDVFLWSVLLKPGLYFLLLCAMTLYSIAVNNRKFFVLLAPFWGLTLTIFLAPVVLFRYVAPLMFATPFLLCELFCNR